MNHRPTVQIQRAGSEAAAVLALLHHHAFADDPRFGRVWSENDFATLLAQPGCFGMVAIDPNQDQGLGVVLSRVVMDEAELLTLGVVPEYRGQGIGRQLLDQVQQHAVHLGARSMFLEVGCNNAAARALYEQAGFRAIGERPGYYTNVVPAESALILCLDFN